MITIQSLDDMHRSAGSCFANGGIEDEEKQVVIVSSDGSYSAEFVS
jgi:hypothetical protein